MAMTLQTRTRGWFLHAMRVLFACFTLLATSAAIAQAAGGDFDHARTGFPLDGVHAQERCDSCHLNGLFKGTPKDCASCHAGGAAFARGNLKKPVHHIPTQAPCESCHNTRSFSGAKFNHVGVAGQCAGCHNARVAVGKTTNHVLTTASCDACHRTSSWFPATGFDHSGVMAGGCASCHNGARAKGRPVAHVPYGAVGAVGNASCDSCHKGGFASFLPAKVHSSVAVTTQCIACHTGAYTAAVGKPNTAIHAAVTQCESCHNTFGWAGAKVDHSTFTAATNCAVCHNGSAATGKPATHVPVASVNCIGCHAKGGPGWKPASHWNHTQVAVAGQCATCHSGAFPPAEGRVGNHVPYAGILGVGNPSCDACHKSGFQAWTPGYFHVNFVVSSQCATCHTGAYRAAVGKPNTAIHAGVTQCEGCHRTGNWLNASVDHATFTAATQCASCHNGVAAVGKAAGHIPVGATNCVACHNKSGPGWRPATFWSHTQVAVAGQCATCHTGGFAPADGRPTNHIPYATVAGVGNPSCDQCHRSGYSSWAPGYFHANVSVGAQCATCHSGAFLGAVGKPNTAVHAGVTNCETCHKVTGWTNASVDHSKYTLATHCASCHNGTTATGRSATHIPTGATNCMGCHDKAPSTWRPSRWTHTQMVVAGQCGTCHSGAFPPADGRPANHVPFASIAGVGNPSCDACHRSGYASWAPGYFHANQAVTAQCATCHTGTYLAAVGKPNTPVHAGVTSCESCHKTTGWVGAKVDHAAYTVATNCASCHNGSTAVGKPPSHMPVGATNCVACHNKAPATWRPASAWNHTQVPVVGQCASCHNGSFPPADAKVTNHIPYTLVPAAAAANCDACHKSGFASWAPGYFHANVSVATQCGTCHTGAYLAAVGKPNTAIHAGVTNCEACHKTTGWAGASVSHTAFTAATNCASCHNGSTASGKSVRHIPVGVTNCIACHNKSPGSWKPSLWNHSQVPVTGQCGTCHNGAYPPADGKPSNHVPYTTQLLNGASMDCGACHTSLTVWSTQKMNHNGSLGNGAGWCKGCHTSGLNFLGNLEKKALNHRNRTPVPTDCSMSGCHRPLGNTGAAYTKWD